MPPDQHESQYTFFLGGGRVTNLEFSKGLFDVCIKMKFEEHVECIII